MAAAAPVALFSTLHHFQVWCRVRGDVRVRLQSCRKAAPLNCHPEEQSDEGPALPYGFSRAAIEVQVPRIRSG